METRFVLYFYNCTLYIQGDRERSVTTHLALLRGWLETQFETSNNQFEDLNRKVVHVGTEDSIIQLKASVMKKRSKKVKINAFSYSAVDLGMIGLGDS